VEEVAYRNGFINKEQLQNWRVNWQRAGMEFIFSNC
jgi:transposase-like protein